MKSIEEKRCHHDSIEVTLLVLSADISESPERRLKTKRVLSRTPDRDCQNDNCRQVQTDDGESQIQRNTRAADQVEDRLQLVGAEPDTRYDTDTEHERLPELVGNVSIQKLTCKLIIE
ncbi:MAG: hypothetical protein R3D26_15050 [Cyanobacteriota/Melainabacteria group bacterium]